MPNKIYMITAAKMVENVRRWSLRYHIDHLEDLHDLISRVYGCEGRFTTITNVVLDLAVSGGVMNVKFHRRINPQFGPMSTDEQRKPIEDDFVCEVIECEFATKRGLNE